MKKVLSRFGKYALVGICAFTLDMTLLYIFIEELNWNYIMATGLAFLISVTCHHAVSRKYVFHDSTESHAATYGKFLLIAASGLIITTTAIAAFVELFHWNLFSSRFLIAGIVGIWSFSMNFFLNFKLNHR